MVNKNLLLLLCINLLCTCALFGQMNCGEGTYYGGVAGSSGGNCGLPVAVGDVYHCAMNDVDYFGSEACGRCVRIIGPKGEVIVKVVDRCPECAPGDIDLTEGAFSQLAQQVDGRVPINWEYVPCEPVTTMKLRFKSSSSVHWTGLQIRDSKYGIESIEYENPIGTWVNINRTLFNYFIEPAGISTPMNLRITNIHGQALLTTIPTIINDVDIDLGIQFSDFLAVDCLGVVGGEAQLDNCGVCSGGDSGIAANSTCDVDCNGYYFGNAYIDGCGACVSGTTGAQPCDADCNGITGGPSYLDGCGACINPDNMEVPCRVNPCACEGDEWVCEVAEPVAVCEGKRGEITQAITSAITVCKQGEWEHYLAPSNDSLIVFSVNKQGDSLDLDVDIAVNQSGVFERTNGHAEGVFLLGRWWNVDVVGTITEPIDIRIYFSDEEFEALETQSTSFTASNGLQSSPVKWFSTMAGAAFDTTLVMSTAITNSFVVDNHAYGALDGVRYVQLNNLQHLSGFGAYVSTSLITLPVVFTSVEVQGGVLSWEVESEEDVSRYEVHVSTDGAVFARLKSMEVDAGVYECTLPDVTKYVKVIALGLNEDESIESEIVAVSTMETTSFGVYPTVSTDIFTVFYEGDDKTTVEVYDLYGKLHGRYEDIRKIGADLLSGVYYVRLSNEGLVQTFRIVKN